jgi:MFS family permease
MTLAAMTLANSMILVDQTSVPLATPDLIQDLGGSISEGPWILTANILPLAALMVMGGRLGDLHGLRRVFLAGACLYVASSALVGFSQDVIWAIAARAAQGFGAALMMPTALAIVSSIYAGPSEAGRWGSWPAHRPSLPLSARCWAECLPALTGGWSSSSTCRWPS